MLTGLGHCAITGCTLTVFAGVNESSISSHEHRASWMCALARVFIQDSLDADTAIFSTFATLPVYVCAFFILLGLKLDAIITTSWSLARSPRLPALDPSTENMKPI